MKRLWMALPLAVALSSTALAMDPPASEPAKSPKVWPLVQEAQPSREMTKVVGKIESIDTQKREIVVSDTISGTRKTIKVKAKTLEHVKVGERVNVYVGSDNTAKMIRYSSDPDNGPAKEAQEK